MPRLFPNVDAFLALPVRERLQSAAGLRAVGGQVAIENVLNNAVLYFPSFYAVQSLYQGGRAIDGLAKFRERWREDVPAIWSFWVPVQTLNFLVSPLWAQRHLPHCCHCGHVGVLYRRETLTASRSSW